MEPSRAKLEPSWAKSGPSWSHFGAKWEPNSDEVRPSRAKLGQFGAKVEPNDAKFNGKFGIRSKMSRFVESAESLAPVDQERGSALPGSAKIDDSCSKFGIFWTTGAQICSNCTNFDQARPRTRPKRALEGP